MVGQCPCTSALQIMRIMGFGSYETAHSMCLKIRAALIEPEPKLGGVVEVDETYIGGKAIINRDCSPIAG
jgi:hypothetical protein